MSAAERQARAMLRNKRTKRPAKTEQEPGAKKQKLAVKPSSRSLAYNNNQALVVKDVLGCVPFKDPLSGKMGLYSPLTQEPSFFYSYPVLLSAPEKKKQLARDQKTLCGVTRPDLVFSVLHRTFAVVYPGVEAQRIVDWELYKWNLAYYGAGIAKRAPQWIDLVEKNSVLRSLGGDKNPVQTSTYTEAGTSKAAYAIDMKTIFPEGETMDRAELLSLKEEALRLIESGSILLVDEDELEEHVSKNEEESDDEESDESSDEE